MRTTKSALLPTSKEPNSVPLPKALLPFIVAIRKISSAVNADGSPVFSRAVNKAIKACSPISNALVQLAESHPNEIFNPFLNNSRWLPFIVPPTPYSIEAIGHQTIDISLSNIGPTSFSSIKLTWEKVQFLSRRPMSAKCTIGNKPSLLLSSI